MEYNSGSQERLDKEKCSNDNQDPKGNTGPQGAEEEQKIEKRRTTEESFAPVDCRVGA